MAYEFKMTCRVAFAETDMGGIMHFSNFFLWMERAEHAFFRSLGIFLHHEEIDQAIGWPRVYANCEYTHPLKFEEESEIHLLVKEIGRSSISYRFMFGKDENGARVEVARGSITAVCIVLHKDSLEAIPIPTEILEKIEPAPPELLEAKKF